MKLPVAARASAWVAGGTFTCKSPPPARKPTPVGHQAGAPGNEQVMAGFCSVCSCGGRLLMAKLLGMTSYEICAPPRTAHRPRPVGSQANPKCGPKLLVSDLGLRKNNPAAGSSAMALRACLASSRGTPDHS